MMRTVLVTGGAAGLGLAMARRFLDDGWTVFICGRGEDGVAKARSEAPLLNTIVADVSSPMDRERMMAEIADRASGLDVLVNNAAVTRAHDYLNDFTLGDDRARDELEINLAAPIALTRLYLRERRRLGRDGAAGAIVMIGTPGALFPLEANPLYCATKAGLHMFTMALRRQLRETAVSVIEVFPPALDTGLARELEVQSQAANGQETIARVAAEIVAGVAAGQEVILPHEQSRQLYGAVPRLGDAFIDRVNAGVRRRPGWDRP